MPRRSARLALLLGASFAFARTAEAQEAKEPVRLVYAAPPNCPTEEAFVAHVREVSPLFRTVSGDESGRIFTIAFEGTERGVAGHLQVEKDGSVVGSRDANGTGCDEVARLLAFAVALAFDPDATSGSAATSSPTPVPPVLPVPSLPAAEPLSRPTPVPQRLGKGDARGAPTSADPGGVRPLTLRGWALSAAGSVASDFSPNAMFGAGLVGEVEGDFAGLRPSLRVGAEYAASEPASVAGAQAKFLTAFGLVEGCVAPWSVASGHFSFGLCLRIDAGARSVTGEDIPHGRTVTGLWLAVGPGVHARWRVRARGPWFVDAGVRGFVPAVRERATFEGISNVYSVGWVGAGGELGVGAYFP